MINYILALQVFVASFSPFAYGAASPSSIEPTQPDQNLVITPEKPTLDSQINVATEAALPTTNPPSDPIAVSDLATQDFTADEMQNFSQHGVQWSEEQESILPTLLRLATELNQKTEIMNAELGTAEVQRRVEANQHIHEIPGVGKIEYRMIDGHRVPRVVLYSNDTAYLLLDEEIVPRDSKHLRQYITRTHMESGQNRPDLDENGVQKRNFLDQEKFKSGRDLVIVAFNDGEPTDWDHLPRPKWTDWAWWKEYFVSKYKRPTVSDFSMSLVMGAAMQGALTLGMTAMKSKYLGTDFTPSPAIFTAGYGALIGTYISTYRNWTMLSGSRLTRVLKSTAVSLAYAYGLVLLVSPGDWDSRLATVSFLTAAGIMHNVSIGLNAISNNYAKDFWNQIMIIRDKTRSAAKPISFNFLGLKSLPVEWKRSHIESQLLYLVPWAINVISLMTLASTTIFQVPGTSFTVPVLQLAAIPIAMQLARLYSRHLANRLKDDPYAQVRARELEEMANHYDEVWRSSFGMDVREVPGKAVDLTNSAIDMSANMILAAGRTVKNSVTTAGRASLNAVTSAGQAVTSAGRAAKTTLSSACARILGHRD